MPKGHDRASGIAYRNSGTIRVCQIAAVLWLGFALIPTKPLARPALAAAPDPETAALLDYLRDQNSTAILIVKDGRTVLEQTWPGPSENPQFALFTYGKTAKGALLEDVASQQKSFVAVLAAIAIDRGLLDLDRPVSAYLGVGWSRAAPDQKAKIRVDHLLQMNSGLDETFSYAAPAGSVFLYNTPVYAVTKRVLEAAARQPLDAITRDWLTRPAGMADTGWRKRPAALASVGNATGLITTPRDSALFGRMVMARGVAANGRRVVSERNLARLFEPTPTNPGYGRLWWLNDGAYAIRALGGRREGPLIAAAPRDMVMALGAFDRKLYIVPSRKLVVVRTGAAAKHQDFDEQLWLKLAPILR